MERLQNEIINKLVLKGEIRSSDFTNDKVSVDKVSGNVEISRQTFMRAIEPLISDNIVKLIGAGPSTKYVYGENFCLAKFNINEYFNIDQNKRPIRTDDNFFKNSFNLINNEELLSLDNYVGTWRYRYNSASIDIVNKELERITIELAWKSSQIEGNTYSLLDTERLIKEAKEAIGHPHAEAIMILNHKQCLKYILENKDQYKILTRSKIEELHSILIEGLNVDKGLRMSGVGIVGTDYKPRDNQYQIGEQIDESLLLVNSDIHVLNKALAIVILIAYIQPFADGNKRTSRMLANALLIANNYPPISFRSIDEVEYKKAIILADEAKNMTYIKQLFIEQFTEACNKYFV